MLVVDSGPEVGDRLEPDVEPFLKIRETFLLY